MYGQVFFERRMKNKKKQGAATVSPQKCYTKISPGEFFKTGAITEGVRILKTPSGVRTASHI